MARWPLRPTTPAGSGNTPRNTDVAFSYALALDCDCPMLPSVFSFLAAAHPMCAVPPWLGRWGGEQANPVRSASATLPPGRAPVPSARRCHTGLVVRKDEPSREITRISVVWRVSPSAISVSHKSAIRGSLVKNQVRQERTGMLGGKPSHQTSRRSRTHSAIHQTAALTALEA
jgi:hypothetical protein